MVDSAVPDTQKRKASLSPPADDEVSKRVKLEGSKGQDGRDDLDSKTEGTSPSQNGSVSKQEDRDEPPAELPVDMPDATSPKGETDKEAAARRAAEAKKVGPAASRRDFSQEEKKRGKRLFGGLLSTLSQTAPNSQHKKRLEIERRQHERAHQQRAEDDKRRTEKLAKLNHVRKIEQVKFDEQVMHTRHSSMLTLAHSLRTRSEPRLYYRPWDLTRDQERTISGQIRAAKETIDREREEFKIRKEKRLKELGVFRPPSRIGNTVGEPKPPDDTNRRVSSSSKMHVEKDHDENADEMVHEEEDTVLY